MLTRKEVLRFYSSFPRLFFMPEDARLYLDIFVRGIFALYYLPVMALILAATHSFLLNIMFSLVVPVLQSDQGMIIEKDAKSPQRLSAHAMFVWAKLIPYTTLGISIAAFAHKILNIVVEAMVDAFSTYYEKDYALLASMLEFTMENKIRRVWYIIVIFVGLSLLGTSTLTNLLIVWSERETRVQAATFYIIMVQFVYIILTVGLVFYGKVTGVASPAGVASPSGAAPRRVASSPSCSPALFPTGKGGPGSRPISPPPLALAGPNDFGTFKDVVAYFVTVWWETSIHRIRFFALQMLGVFATYWAVTCGLLDALSFTVETLIYLNFPHLFGFTASHVTISIIRIFQSGKWAVRHSEHLSSIALLVLPYQLLLAYTIYYFEFNFSPTMLLGWATIHLWARAVDIIRKHHVSAHVTLPSGGLGTRAGARWYYVDNNEPIPITFAIVLEDAAERGKDVPAVVSLDTTFSLNAMTITDANGEVRKIARQVVVPVRKDKERTKEEKEKDTDKEANSIGDEQTSVKDTPAKNKKDLGEEISAKIRRRKRGASNILFSPPEHQLLNTSMTSVRVGVTQHTREEVINWKDFLLHYYPQILVLQSAPSFSGRRFDGARILTKIFTGLLFVIFLCLTTAVVIQTTFEMFRPVAVHAYYDRVENTLLIDHTVAGITVRGKTMRGEKDATPPPLELKEQPSSSTTTSNGRAAKLSPSTTELRLCNVDFSGVSVFEMSWFATLAYIDLGDIQDVLDFMNRNMGTDWEVKLPIAGGGDLHNNHVNAHDRDRHHAHSFERDWMGFMELHSKQYNAIIIAVRGTDLTSSVDMIQDVSIFFEAVLYQFLTNIVPGTSVLPSELVTDFIKISSAAHDISNGIGWEQLSKKRPLNSERHYYTTVLKHVEGMEREYQELEEPPTILLTGHSLGGAITAIVGAKLHKRSVSFSAPGIVLSRKKFDVDLEDIHRTAFNIIGSHDIVPYLGWQGGELHHLRCRATVREACHAIEHTIHALWENCPSVRAKYGNISHVHL